jgi:hypothetical protein
MRSSRRVTLLLAALLVASAPGCEKKRVTECNALITVINGGIQSLEKKEPPKLDASGIGELKALADVLDKVATDASQVELTFTELKTFSTDYQGMAKEVAKTAREMASAAEAKDDKKMTVAQGAMEKAVKQEDPLVDGINKFCAVE